MYVNFQMQNTIQPAKINGYILSTLSQKFITFITLEMSKEKEFYKQMGTLSNISKLRNLQ